MQSFCFNTIYIMESLGDNESKTGLHLYDELCKVIKPTPAKYVPITSGEEWDQCMDKICQACAGDGVKPIIHLELHGDNTGIGFVNGDIRDHRTLCAQFSKINFACGCNMLLTLGVCEGLNILKGIQISVPMPYIGAIGSFEELWNVDIELRFTEFYKELLSSHDMNKAYSKLLDAESEYHEIYRFFPIDELFYRTYVRYLKEQCSKDALKERAHSSIINDGRPVKNRHERREMERKFIKIEKETRMKEYKDFVNTFFAVKQDPSNLKRFEVPVTFTELRQKFGNDIEE